MVDQDRICLLRV